MQMLFTYYHMVLFQVIMHRRDFPLINVKGWSENTVYQETLGACSRNVIRLTLGCWNLFQATQLTFMLIAIRVWLKLLTYLISDRRFLVESGNDQFYSNSYECCCRLKCKINITTPPVFFFLSTYANDTISYWRLISVQSLMQLNYSSELQCVDSDTQMSVSAHLP